MGRPKGAKNIKSFDAEILAARLKVNPLEIMLKFAAGDWKGLGYESDRYEIETASGNIKQVYTISPSMRLEASKEATKYLHAQKKSVELSTSETGFKIVVEDYLKKND